jgi:Hint domain
MSYSPPTLPPFPAQTTRRVVSQPVWTARRVSRPAPTHGHARVTRRFETEWLADGEVHQEMRVAPALPVFEQAFGAFTHGVLIQTTDGPVAVEDLIPGMHLECASGRVTRLMWKGSIMLVPGAPALSDIPDHLYRVMPDAFGLGRPLQDQTFGPHMRRLDRDPKVRATMGCEAALVPLSVMADGYGVIQVNLVSPTRVYHLACETHETILAAGLEVETYHPGPETPLSLSEEMMEQFMAFFPHLTSIRDFGRLAAPRITTDEMAAIA